MMLSSVGTDHKIYASVILDLQARELKDRLFTYEVPAHLAASTFIGAQVLVPFGRQDMVAGYVVSLGESKDVHLDNIKTREISDVIAQESLFDEQYIDFLYWVCDYYCATLADVIAAAVPSFFSPRIKQMVRLDAKMAAQIHNDPDPKRRLIVDILAESKSGTLALSVLRQRWAKDSKLGQSHFYKPFSHMRREGVIQLTSESSSPKSPKTVSVAVWTGEEGKTARQKEIVSLLKRNNGQLLLKSLIDEAGTTHATIKNLSNKGIITLTEQEVVRDSLTTLKESAPEASLPDLTEAQSAALAKLSAALTDTLRATGELPPKPWLVHGVTGSGKTEIYLRLIQQAIDLERGALLLVPEISLTPQLARRLIERFGTNVAVWHSALSEGERYDTWRRLRTGEVKVLLGARSAILVHVPALCLIILDEEHDGSYKQSSPSPRYNAREVAVEKARRQGALVVFGSATPDVCSFRESKESGQYLSLPERVFKQSMPEVNIVDMRSEFAEGNRGIFSCALQGALTQCLGRQEQAILLMNRRGYANHVFCRACGYVVKCRNCSVSLVFHQARRGQEKDSFNLAGPDPNDDGYLSCHHCGFQSQSIVTCPACRSPFIRQYGLGTQRVEEEVRQRHPRARILRLDSDVASGRGAHEEIFKKFAAGEADVLIGTQMVSKGLDIPLVTLVGVLAADAAFNLPDYRAIERGFQLLTQVSGRAGRGDRQGQVIWQAFATDMPALGWARQHDYETFAEAELAARRAYSYPPFGQLIRAVVSGGDIYAVEAACEKLAEELSQYIDDIIPADALVILGPAPCLIERIRGKFRFHLLVKNLAGEEGRVLVNSFFRAKRMPDGITLAVDVNAVDLL